jgi:hypothetical protein
MRYRLLIKLVFYSKMGVGDKNLLKPPIFQGFDFLDFKM